MGAAVVTIDGPAGSGKSTVARALAERTGIPFLSTGMLYRAVGHLARRSGVDMEREGALVALLDAHTVAAVPVEGGFEIRIDGEAVEPETLRDEGVGEWASRVAARPAVRSCLLDVQRRAATEAGIVVEGRDTGTIVFPDADLKVFLTADPVIRAQRRARELGLDPDAPAVLADLNRRDRRDRERETAPLVRPEGAVEVDSGARSVGEIVDRLVSLIDL